MVVTSEMLFIGLVHLDSRPLRKNYVLFTHRMQMIYDKG